MVGSTPGNLSLSHQEEGVEHDRFGESDGQNRLDQNLRRGAGITAHGYRSSHADQTNPKSCAKRCQTNVNAPSHMVPLSFPWFPSLNMIAAEESSTCAAADSSPSCWQISRVKTAHNNMKTKACTKPTSTSMK